MANKNVFLFGAAALALSLVLIQAASAQQRGRDRDRGPQGAVEDDGRQQDGERDRRGDGRDGRRGEPDRRGGRDGRAAPERRAAPQRGGAGDPRRAGDRQPPRPQAAPPAQRREVQRDRRRAAPAPRQRYDRRPERSWHRDGRPVRPNIYIPRRWAYRDRPHHRHLWNRHYGRVWWCGVNCRIGLLFGFTVWTVHTVVSYDSSYSFPIWEALEYNRTGETALWESGWGYVEFTPTRTFRRGYGGYSRDCRDFTRIVVRSDGLERHYRGTACRNPNGSWWIVSSARVL